MNIYDKDTLLGEFLNILEGKEQELLTWGVVEGAIEESELGTFAKDFVTSLKVEPAIPNFVQEWIDEPLSLVDDLEDRHFLFKVPGTNSYRTRMGEGVRLMSRLRQLFPKHMRSTDWQSAKTLVADYRLLLRARRYPKREYSIERTLEELEKIPITDHTKAGFAFHVGTQAQCEV